MARGSKQSRSVVLNPKVEVEITPAAFKPYAALEQLDVDRLARAANTRIEVGYFETSCCKRMVTAVIKKGMVTKLELDPCEGEQPASPELVKLILEARKKLGVGRRGSRALPVPVAEFLADPAALVIEVWGCIKICMFGYCLLCCYDIGVGKPWGMCSLNRAERA